MRNSVPKDNHRDSLRKPVVHILYPSSWDVDKWAEAHKKGIIPDKYQYGYDRLEHYGFKVTYARFPRSKIMQKLGGLLRQIPPTFNPYCFIFQLNHFLQADIFINPLDHEGLMLCWLRKHKMLNLHNKIHIFRPAWLPAWIQEASRRQLKRLRSLMGTVDVLMYFGEYDKKIFKERLLIPDEKLEKTYWGIDADFFKPYKTNRDDFILAPGNDAFRDFEILAEVASDLPQEKFIIASSKKIHLKTKPPNLIIKAQSHREILDHYLKAKAVIIPLKKGCPTASGSTVLKEALLLNKRIIVSATDLMQELSSGFEDHVILAEPGSKKSLQESIIKLNQPEDKPLPELKPEQKTPLTSAYYMEKLSQIINRRVKLMVEKKVIEKTA